MHCSLPKTFNIRTGWKYFVEIHDEAPLGALLMNIRFRTYSHCGETISYFPVHSTLASPTSCDSKPLEMKIAEDFTAIGSLCIMFNGILGAPVMIPSRGFKGSSRR